MIPFDPESLRDGDAITKDEGNLLAAIVMAVKPKICYETGSHKGLSAAYIAYGLSINGEGHLHTYDPYEWGASGNLAPLVDWVTYHQQKGEEAEVTGPIDFLFIDGYHQKEAVINEFLHFLPHLSPNAIVMFHDMHEADHSKLRPGEIAAADVNGAIRELGIKVTMIPTFNRMGIYEHSQKV